MQDQPHLGPVDQAAPKLLTGLGATGKDHRVHLRMQSQLAPDGIVALDQVKHARRQASDVHHLGVQLRGRGTVRTGLPHHRVACNQGRDDVRVTGRQRQHRRTHHRHHAQRHRQHPRRQVAKGAIGQEARRLTHQLVDTA